MGFTGNKTKFKFDTSATLTESLTLRAAVDEPPPPPSTEQQALELDVSNTIREEEEEGIPEEGEEDEQTSDDTDQQQQDDQPRRESIEDHDITDTSHTSPLPPSSPPQDEENQSVAMAMKSDGNLVYYPPGNEVIEDEEVNIKDPIVDVVESDDNIVFDHDNHDDYEDTDDGILEERKRQHCGFAIELISNIFFFIASSMYLWMSIQDYLYEQHASSINELLKKHIDCNTNVFSRALRGGAQYHLGLPFSWFNHPDHIRDGCIRNKLELWRYDDDWVFGDDTVFTRNNGVDITVYSIVYFSAASLFVIQGIIDFFHPEQTGLHKFCAGIFFIVAGALDVAAALTMEQKPIVSANLDLSSSCFFFIEAIQMIWFHEKGLRPCLKFWTYVAIALFAIGSLLDVIVAFVTRFASNGGEFDYAFTVVGVFDNTCWVASAIIFIVLTIYYHKFDDDEDEDEDGKSN